VPQYWLALFKCNKAALPGAAYSFYMKPLCAVYFSIYSTSQQCNGWCCTAAGGM